MATCSFLHAASHSLHTANTTLDRDKSQCLGFSRIPQSLDTSHACKLEHEHDTRQLIAASCEGKRSRHMTVSVLYACCAQLHPVWRPTCVLCGGGWTLASLPPHARRVQSACAAQTCSPSSPPLLHPPPACGCRRVTRFGGLGSNRRGETRHT
jgi:hypothetical protein